MEQDLEEPWLFINSFNEHLLYDSHCSSSLRYIKHRSLTSRSEYSRCGKQTMNTRNKLFSISETMKKERKVEIGKERQRMPEYIATHGAARISCGGIAHEGNFNKIIGR